MTKRWIMRVALITLGVAILVSIALMAWRIATDGDDNVINVRLDDGKTEVVEFSDLCLIPGESCEYFIHFDVGNIKKYDLTLDFVETEENEKKTLKNFARIKIESGEQVICDELLASVIDGECITLPVDIKENQNTKIKISYYLPEDIGNEAQNAEAVFELHLTASNE